MTTNESLEEHRRQPRNMGRLGNADAVGTVGSITIGRALRFFLRFEGERVAEARFQVFACAEMIPSTSALTELAVGRTASEAAALDRAAIAAHLDDCDHGELPIAPWGLAGLQAALRSHQGAGTDETPVDEELPELVCRCHGVSRQDIESLAGELGPDAEQIRERSGAGSGCGSCRRDIAALLEAPQPEPPAASTNPVKGRVAMMRQIEAACERLVAKAKETGGSLQLWDLNEHQVVVRLGGNLAGDGPERRGLLDSLERTLKDDVDPLLSVAVDDG